MKTWHRIMLLNLVLLILLALGVWRVGQQWRLFEATRTLEAIGAQAGPGPAAAAMPPLQETTTEGWEDIATQNPFSFDRSSFVYEPENASIRGTDQPVLLGTLMLGGDRMAMMAPAGARNNRSSTTLRVGEEIDGWELAEVREKSVVIEAGTISETVVMNDPSALVPRAAQASSTPSGSPHPLWCLLPRRCQNLHAPGLSPRLGPLAERWIQPPAESEPFGHPLERCVYL